MQPTRPKNFFVERRFKIVVPKMISHFKLYIRKNLPYVFYAYYCNHIRTVLMLYCFYMTIKCILKINQIFVPM